MKAGKRILKFIIESVAVVLVIYSIFTTGKYIKSKKINETPKEQTQQVEQTNSQNENQNKENKNEQNSNRKMSKTELDQAMDNVIAKYKGNNEIGLVYKNFATSYRYAANDDKYFTAASTTKVIYAMNIYDRINKGELDKDYEVDYSPKFLREGGGEITNQPKKDSYPLDYVLKNMIEFSDNTATEMLVGNSATAADVKIKYLNALGVTLPSKEAASNRVTPAMMEEVWTKLYKEKDNYKDLMNYLIASSDNEWIKNGIKDKKIASKYGGYGTYMHDTAIVFGNQDYMLLIYTNNLRNSGQSITEMAKEINEITDNYM